MPNRLEEIHVQPLVPHRPIESFDVGILSWLARLNIHQGYLMLIRTVHESLRYVLRAIAARGSVVI